MRTRALALILVVALQGCASIVGTITQPSPYVGVTLDASYVANTYGGSGYWLTVPFVVLDLPLSAVMDTLLLPWTALVAAEGK